MGVILRVALEIGSEQYGPIISILNALYDIPESFDSDSHNAQQNISLHSHTIIGVYIPCTVVVKEIANKE